ncbi:hypothetical protein QYF36_010502 [Acer negundo]|nr:hypothetical protein QYF36_010502 [Acer negundo]
MRLGSSGETSATHVRLLMPLFNAATRTALLLVILSPAPIEGPLTDELIHRRLLARGSSWADDSHASLAAAAGDERL